MYEPKLRFKDIEGREYPSWNKMKVVDFAETFIGLVTTMTKHYVDEGIPLIRNSDIKEYKIAFKECIYLDNDFAEKNKRRRHKQGDIVTVHTGDIGTSAVIEADLEGSIGFATIVTRIINDEIHPDFVCWYFNSDIFKKFAFEHATGDGRNNLNMRDFNKAEICVPTLSEQKRIVELLSSISLLITNQESKIADLVNRKKSLLQKIFCQEIRFKDENGRDFADWEEKELDQLGKFFKGAILSKSDLSDKGIPCILYGQLYTIYSEVVYDVVSKTEKKNPNIVLSNKMDVIIPMSGETSEDISSASCIMQDGVALGSDLIVFRGKRIDGRIISYLLNYQQKYKIARLAQGKTIVHISKDSLKKIIIKYPVSKQEQIKIASFMDLINQHIDNEKEILNDWKQMKKGLLQQLFI